MEKTILRFFRYLSVYKETKLSIRNCLTYFEVIYVLQQQWFTKKKMEVWSYSIVDDPHDRIHALHRPISFVLSVLF